LAKRGICRGFGRKAGRLYHLEATMVVGVTWCRANQCQLVLTLWPASTSSPQLLTPGPPPATSLGVLGPPRGTAAQRPNRNSTLMMSGHVLASLSDW
jgi:hypothetical protein